MLNKIREEVLSKSKDKGLPAKIFEKIDGGTVHSQEKMGNRTLPREDPTEVETGAQPSLFLVV